MFIRVFYITCCVLWVGFFIIQEFKNDDYFRKMDNKKLSYWHIVDDTKGTMKVLSFHKLFIALLFFLLCLYVD